MRFFGFSVTELGFLFFLFFMSYFVGFMVFAQGGDMLGVFLSHISGEVRAIGGAAGFDLGDVFGAKARSVFRMNFLNFVSGFSFLFRVFFFKDGAANDGIGFCRCGGLFVFGFDKIGR